MVLNERLEKYLQFQKIFLPSKLKPEKTALMVIDMQIYQVRKTGASYLTMNKLSPGVLDYFVDRVENVVEPNLMDLLDFCREKGVKIIYTKYCSFSEDGSDLTRRYKLVNEASLSTCEDIVYPPISHPQAKIIDSLKPKEDKGDIVLIKNTSGTFMSTALETILKNMGIENLLMTGVVTHFCVECTAREGADLGFNIILVEDCCAGWSETMHEHSLKTMEMLYANVIKLKKLKRLIEKSMK